MVQPTERPGRSDATYAGYVLAILFLALVIWLTVREPRRDQERAPLRVMLWSAPLAIPGLLLFLLVPTSPVALVGAAIAAFFISVHFGPLVAVTIGVVGPEHRGLASSVLVIAQFLVGFGLGPLIVGAVSDRIEPFVGAASLRYAMLLAPLAVAGGWTVVVLADSLPLSPFPLNSETPS